MTLQTGKKYPYIPPTVELENIKGLTDKERIYLMEMIHKRCQALSENGSVMVCELVQLTEDFLLIHNKDPSKANISAWEQMKAREEKQRKHNIERDKMLFHWSEDKEPSSTSFLSKDPFLENPEQQVEIQKEIQRQMDALDIADEGRRKNKISYAEASNNGNNKDNNPSSSDDLFTDDEEDIDFDTYNDQTLNSSSRYKSDFVELKFLGRGGGGEVVKVINKLDRRRCKFSKPSYFFKYYVPFLIKRIMLQMQSKRSFSNRKRVD